MRPDHKDNSPINEEQTAQGPFSEKQMRLLKAVTAIMGVMIVVCIVLLGIGLSQQSKKLAQSDDVPAIIVAPKIQILSFSADADGGLWLHIKGPDLEGMQYYSASGKKGSFIAIERQ
ncbi:MAG: hypothetical protein ACON4G_00965 [Candidatus Puniceispirillaceae bacterium]